MSRTKIWLLAAGALVLAGCILFAGTLAAQGWDVTKLSTVSFETNTHEIKEDFRDIAVTTDTANIAFAVSDDDTCRVVCCEAENAKHAVSVTDQTLMIASEGRHTWRDDIGFSLGTPQLTVYLPQTQYRALTIDGSTGNVEIPKEFAFDRAEITLSTGNADLAANVSDTAKTATTTGNIRVENTSVGALALSVTTGAAEVSGVRCQNELTLGVTTGAAAAAGCLVRKLRLHRRRRQHRARKRACRRQHFDRTHHGPCGVYRLRRRRAARATDTGSVTGSLLSDKIFFAQSDVGSVNVPKTTTGGICEITTATGAIEMTID